MNNKKNSIDSAQEIRLLTKYILLRKYKIQRDNGTYIYTLETWEFQIQPVDF